MSDHQPENDRTDALAALFDDVRREHLIDVMQSSLLACTCGEQLPVVYGDDGRPTYNPAIRHHHEQYARAVVGLGPGLVIPPAQTTNGD